MNEKLMAALTAEIERRAVANDQYIFDIDRDRDDAYDRIVSFLVEIGLGKDGGDGCA
jgi:hypothetical protein